MTPANKEFFESIEGQTLLREYYEKNQAAIKKMTLEIAELKKELAIEIAEGRISAETNPDN